jgi:hypothetical protein
MRTSVVLFVLFAMTAVAQSPHTGAIFAVLTDQKNLPLQNAKATLKHQATGFSREAVSDEDGRVAFTALPVDGSYSIVFSRDGFAEESVESISLRAGEAATLRLKLAVQAARAQITTYGTTDGVQADPQLGKRLDSAQIDQLPVLGRKVTSLPLYSAAFRQAKGTGDLFVNVVYFVTGVGGRRQTTALLDGASNDEAWGRQTMMAQIPVGAIEEMTTLSNAFSSEFGWTSGPALNIVTKSGSNVLHGELLYTHRPGDLQAKRFSTANFCPESVPSCVSPSTLRYISPANIPDSLSQLSGSVGGSLRKDRTFVFLAADLTNQDRTSYLSTTLPEFLLPSDGRLAYTGRYRQRLANARADQKLTDSQSLMGRFNFDTFYDDNPQDSVGGTNALSVARKYSRQAWTAQANHTVALSAQLLNEARVAYLNGDPVARWEAGNLSTTYTRAGSVPFTIGQSRLSNLYSRQFQISDTLSWTSGWHYLRVGASLVRHSSGGTGSEPGTAVLGTFTFRSTNTAPFDQLTLADVQQYTQPIDFGVSSYRLTQWLTAGFVQDRVQLGPALHLDLGIRYDHQSPTNASRNLAPRLGFGWHPRGNPRFSFRGGYGMYYQQIRSNLAGAFLINGLDGLTTYTAVPGQFGFPTCLTGACLPLKFDPRILPASQLPARDIIIQAGKKDFYSSQFARYGLNFSRLGDYPEKLVNPRSQVFTFGAEQELLQGLVVSADYVHQHVSDLERTVDLNAPLPFTRLAPGEARTVAAANGTRPILPENGGVRQVNVLMNFGLADYDGLQTQITYRGPSRLYASAGYTLSKTTNTTEPDGNGVGPNESHISRLGEIERGPSLLDQRHRAVVMLSYRLPLSIHVGTISQFASARPFNATTGVDNNGDGINNDRPVVDGRVLARSAFRGSRTSDVGAFLESRLRTRERFSVALRLEGFNLLNHGNFLGRVQTIYGDAGAPLSTFGQFATVGTGPNAVPAFANIDPPRMFQVQLRIRF